MPLAVKINVALREQNCQKIGSERVKLEKRFQSVSYDLWQPGYSRNTYEHVLTAAAIRVCESNKVSQTDWSMDKQMQDKVKTICHFAKLSQHKTMQVKFKLCIGMIL